MRSYYIITRMSYNNNNNNTRVSLYKVLRAKYVQMTRAASKYTSCYIIMRSSI